MPYQSSKESSFFGRFRIWTAPNEKPRGISAAATRQSPPRGRRDDGYRESEVSRFTRDLKKLVTKRLDVDAMQAAMVSLLDRVEGSHLQTVLYTFLIDETKTDDQVRLMNAWKLFKDIAEMISCPTEMAESVERHLRCTSQKTDLDPLCRVLIRGVLDSVTSSKSESLPSSHGSIVDRHLNGDVFLLDVYLHDQTAVQLIYDRNTTISNAVSQVAWSLGINKPALYELYEQRGGGCLVLNPKRYLIDVLLDTVYSTATPKRLIFNKELSTVTNEEKTNPDRANTSFVWWKEQYLEGHCHVDDDVAAQLCVLHILAHYDLPGQGDRHSFHKFINERMSSCLPERCLEGKSENARKELVAHSFRKLGHCTQMDAKLHFLQMVRSLRCADCCECTVQTSEDFPVSLREGTKVKLVIVCSGLLILDGDRCENKCLLAVDFSRIESWRMRGRTLTLHIRQGKREICFNLATDAGEHVCQAMSRHTNGPPLPGNGDLSPPHDLCLHATRLPSGDCPDEETETSSERTHASQETSSSSSRGKPQSPLAGSEDMTDEDAGWTKLQTQSPFAIHRPTTHMELREEFSHLMGVLKNFKEDDLFARKYKIQPGRAGSKSHVLFARDINSKDDVVLKFYSSRALYDNCKDKHRRLIATKHVVKLLDFVEEEGYPLCLVFQRGDVSFEEWMEKMDPHAFQRKEAMLQVLMALIDIHSSKLVYCDLRPANIMFFASEYRWKLLGLDSGAIAGQPSAVCPVLKYAAPEIIQAGAHRQNRVALETSADMWSFGIMLFEVMSGMSFYGPNVSPETIRAQLCSGHELIDGVELGCVNEPQVQSLIKRVLKMDPRARRSAGQAAVHATFRSATSTTQKKIEITTVAQKLDRVIGITQLSLDQLTAANLITAIKVESFKRGSDPEMPFHLREGSEVLSMADDYLPDNPVFLMRVRESHRIRITLMHDRLRRLPIKKIERVNAVLPGQEIVELKTVQQTTNESMCEAVALLDPSKTNCERLLKTSPIVGRLDVKYLPIDLTVTVSSNSGAKHTFELKFRIHCQIVNQGHRSTVHKFTREFSNLWSRFPQWARDVSRSACFCASLAIGDA